MIFLDPIGSLPMNKACHFSRDDGALTDSKLLKRVEDAEDKAIVAAAEARERAHGKERARRDYLSGELAKRLILGESPVRIWREHCRRAGRAAR